MTNSTLVWLRNDLRIADNPALQHAWRDGGPVTALYIHESPDLVRAPGGAARWWLERSLENLAPRLAAHNTALMVADGDARQLLPDMARRLGAQIVRWNRRYAEAERSLDATVKSTLTALGFEAVSHAGNLLVEPWRIKSGSGGPYQVFTPFAKALKLALEPEAAGSIDDAQAARAQAGHSQQRDAAGHVRDAMYTGAPPPSWAGGMAAAWRVGEEAAAQRLGAFLDDALTDYSGQRDVPGVDGTSRMSPYLRFGEISARQAWRATLAAMDAHASVQTGGEKFLTELIWRDFHYHQLFHRPDISRHDMRDTLSDVTWRHDPAALSAWRQGRTGIPMIDAGMRQLWATGWMHNRVRMLVASFLTKNLMIDWREGEAWFWDTLVDADVASNPSSWQWVAGCGMDAAPYFRVFNPVLQGGRYDADGDYVRTWVPELARLPDRWIQQPFAAPQEVLSAAGVRPGVTYPLPIAPHSKKRTPKAAS